MKKRDIDSHHDTPAEYGVLRELESRQQKAVPTQTGRWRNYYENIEAVLRARIYGRGWLDRSSGANPKIGEV